jgi:hypothetical protein
VRQPGEARGNDDPMHAGKYPGQLGRARAHT